MPALEHLDSNGDIRNQILKFMEERRYNSRAEFDCLDSGPPIFSMAQ